MFWELASNDMKASVDFFRDVFGWQIDYSDRLGFYIIPDTSPQNKAIDGAIFTLRKAKLPFLTVFIQVDDIIEKARQVEEHGGYILEKPNRVPGGAHICLFNEPSGVTFAMIEPMKEELKT